MYRLLEERMNKKYNLIYRLKNVTENIDVKELKDLILDALIYTNQEVEAKDVLPILKNEWQIDLLSNGNWFLYFGNYNYYGDGIYGYRYSNGKPMNNYVVGLDEIVDNPLKLIRIADKCFKMSFAERGYVFPKLTEIVEIEDLALEAIHTFKSGQIKKQIQNKGYSKYYIESLEDELEKFKNSVHFIYPKKSQKEFVSEYNI